jgi:hypothetical protein
MQIIRRGRRPYFDSYHIWKTYQILRKDGPIGREALAKRLGIGVGSTRTIITQIVRKGHATTSRKGILLTSEGKKYFDKTGILIEHIRLDDKPKKYCAAIIRGQSRSPASPRFTIGSVTMKENESIYHVWIENDSLHVIENAHDELIEAGNIQKILNLQPGDILILATSSSDQRAEMLAVTEALSIIKSSNPCGKEGRVQEEKIDLRCMALIIHELMGRLPVTMRYRDQHGVRVERGEIIDDNYTGPVLEEALQRGSIVKKVATSGPYKGVPIIAVPVRRNNEIIAVFGAVDITKGAVFELMNRLVPSR